MADTIWHICFICQVSSKDNVRSSADGWKTLVKIILEFYKKGKLGFHFEGICDANLELLSVLTTNELVYHNNCFLKYSDSKLKRFNEPSKKLKCTEDEKERMSACLSAASRERFNLFCCRCCKKDVDANLVPAGTYQARKLTTKSNHVKDLTAKWIDMTTKLNHEPALYLLSSGDVASNELYYHDKCYDTIRHQYSKFTKSDESSSMRDKECKQIALKNIIFYLKDSKMFNPGNLYPVMELETMYSDLLKSGNIYHNNHTTTFADLLVKHVPGLNKKTANKRVSVFFDTAAIGLNMSSETYFDSLVKVIGPARKEIHQKCQEHYSPLNVDLHLVPIKLVQLINFLQDRIDLNDKGYSKEALAISQNIIYNFRYNIKNKGISSYKQHNKITHPPFPLHVAIKLYSSSRSKTLVSWLYFCAGISHPYKSLLELTRDIVNRMISQYNRDGAFLPRTLRKDILTIIAKDHIDKNSKSNTATRHYHGTSLSIFKFPTEDNSSIAVEMEV